MRDRRAWRDQISVWARIPARACLDAVVETIEWLTAAVEPDYVVLGGENAKKVAQVAENVRLGANTNAFLGGFRL